MADQQGEKVDVEAILDTDFGYWPEEAQKVVLALQAELETAREREKGLREALLALQREAGLDPESSAMEAAEEALAASPGPTRPANG